MAELELNTTETREAELWAKVSEFADDGELSADPRKLKEAVKALRELLAEGLRDIRSAKKVKGGK